MTWFRCGGGGSGIPAALKNRMNAVLNKKFGTAVDYPAEGWPGDVNLLGLLEEKTVSGTIATFSDGADEVPIKSWEVEIAPTLSGKSAIECAQTGKNILNGEDAVKTANNIRFYYTNGKYYHAGTYTLSISESVSGIYVRNVSTSANIFAKYNTNFITFTLTEQTLIGFDFYKVGINQDDNVMLEVGSTASTFEPYSSAVSTVNLGRTIYGGTADIVNGTGRGTYTKVKLSDLTWTKGTASGRECYNAFISTSETTNTHDIVTDLTYSGMVTVANMTDKSIAKWQQSVRIYDTDISSVSELLETYGNEYIAYPNKYTVDFTFTPITPTPETALGVNNFWADEGDTEVTYRSSGTMTPITPTLITKTITANGTYQAADDQADGYSEVVVNVPQPTPAVDSIMSLNAFVSKSGVSGTNTSTVARSFTMSAAGTLIFASGSYGFTNTGSNDGYFEIQKNGVSVVKQYCNTSTNTPITIPNISVEENDVVDLVVGFDNAHSNCNYQFYSAMVVLSEV